MGEKNHNIMKYIRLFENYDDTRETIVDICQELLDDDSIRIVFDDLGGNTDCVLFRSKKPYPKNHLELSSLIEYLLRIKDYLGNKYINIRGRIEGTDKYIDIDFEDFESKYLGICVDYKK